MATAGGRVSLLSVVLASLLAAAACGGTERARGEAAAEPKVERSAADGGRAGGQEATMSGAGEDGAVARAGDAEARAGGEAGGAVARAGDAEARAGGPAIEGNSREGQGAAEDDAADGAAGDGTPGKVMLRVRGDRGTEFSGVCSVGDRERNLEGRAPERYAFGPGGSKLECEIRNDGGGDLEVALAGEGVRSVQQTNSRGATVRFALSEGGFSSSTSSSSTS